MPSQHECCTVLVLLLLFALLMLGKAMPPAAIEKPFSGIDVLACQAMTRWHRSCVVMCAIFVPCVSLQCLAPCHAT
jgi:hypothetical protein